MAAEVIGVAALEHRLWLVARDRRLSMEPRPTRSCPTCDSPRVANFRWCQSCGTDFEPWRVAATPAPATSRAPVQTPTASPPRTATLERPAAKVTPSASVTAPSPRSLAPGVATFVLDPATAATASMAASGSPAADARPTEIRIASDRLPPVPRHVVPPPARRGIRVRLSDALEESPFEGRLVVGTVAGLAIGVVVTIVLLGFEAT